MRGYCNSQRLQPTSELREVYFRGSHSLTPVVDSLLLFVSGIYNSNIEIMKRDLSSGKVFNNELQF